MGGKGIEMRDLCRRHCSFISFLQSEWPLCRVKKQADIQADSDHTANVCLSYLDIHSKHLNQVVLNGPHPLLIETQAVPDNLICLRNGGDINSTWLRQWPPSVVGIKPIQHFIIPSLSGESRRTVSLYLLFSAVPLLPPSLSLYPPPWWYEHPGSRQEHHQHARCAGVMQIASVLVMEGTAIDREQEMAAAGEPLFG